MSASFIRLTLIAVCILTLAACSSAQLSNDVKCDEYSTSIKMTEQYKKDSIFLGYTINKWIDNSCGWFGHYNRRNAPNGFYKIHVGDVFYDSTKLKLMAFVFVEYSTDYIDTLYEKVKDVNAHLFDSHTVMGYRDSSNQPWKLFELGEIFMGIRGAHW